MAKRDSAWARALSNAVLVLDGGTGTGLMGLCPGVDVSRGLERLVVEDPESVTGLHLAYIRAGCDVVRTNTFQGSEPELASFGLEGQSRALARRAAGLAREAIRVSERAGVFVLGVLGPGRSLEAEGRSATLAAEGPRIAGLVEGGVDALLIETACSIERVRATLQVAEDLARETPIVVSATPARDGALPDGSTLAELADLCRDSGVVALGLNCAAGPSSLDAPLAEIRAAWDGPLGAWPNAGVPAEGDGGTVWPVAPGELARWAAAGAREHDLRLIGGCCGTTPAHVAKTVEAREAL